MAQQKPAPQQSMDEILASIRKIISDDGRPGAPDGPPPPEAARARSEALASDDRPVHPASLGPAPAPADIEAAPAPAAPLPPSAEAATPDGPAPEPITPSPLAARLRAITEPRGAQPTQNTAPNAPPSAPPPPPAATGLAGGAGAGSESRPLSDLLSSPRRRIPAPPDIERDDADARAEAADPVHPGPGSRAARTDSKDTSEAEVSGVGFLPSTPDVREQAVVAPADAREFSAPAVALPFEPDRPETTDPFPRLETPEPPRDDAHDGAPDADVPTYEPIDAAPPSDAVPTALDRLRANIAASRGATPLAASAAGAVLSASSRAFGSDSDDVVSEPAITETDEPTGLDLTGDAAAPEAADQDAFQLDTSEGAAAAFDPSLPVFGRAAPEQTSAPVFAHRDLATDGAPDEASTVSASSDRAGDDTLEPPTIERELDTVDQVDQEVAATDDALGYEHSDNGRPDASPLAAGPAIGLLGAASASPTPVSDAAADATAHQTAQSVQTLEQVVAEMLRPKMNAWLDENLERIAADVLAEELAKRRADLG